VASWALFRVPYRHVLRSGASGGSDPNAGSAPAVRTGRAAGRRRYERVDPGSPALRFGARRRSRPGWCTPGAVSGRSAPGEALGDCQ